MPGDADRRYRFGPFELRPRESLLLRDGAPVELQPQTYAALSFFVERAGELVTKEELYARLWPDTFVNEEALTQVVRKLRVALGDDAREPRYLQTVLKRGHRFVAPIEILVEPPDTRLAPATARPAPPRGRRPLLMAGLASGLVVALFAAWAVNTTWRGEEPSAGRGRGTRLRLTATPEREQEAVFSPDGKSYAYAAYDADSAQFDLFLASFAGGNRVRLTHTTASEYYPQFSPAGDAIAFTRGTNDGASSIFTISPLGGNERLLVGDAAWGVYSPDGRTLAYARRVETGQILVRRDLATAEETEITRFAGIGSPAWSPDGRQIAFTDQRAVWLVDARGGAPRRLGEAPDSLRSVAWTPDGAAILCDASWDGASNDLWRLPLAGGAPEPVAAAGGAFHPAIARDGRRILLTVEHKIRQLWRVDASGRNPRPLAASTTVECIDVEPRGRWLAFSDWSPRPGETSLGILDLETMETRVLAEGTCAAVAPDGEAVAYFAADRPGLWLRSLASGAERELVPRTDPAGFVEANLYRKPAFAPDGRRLAFPAYQPESGLFVVDADGQGLRRLARGTFGPPAYSPDGRRVAALGRRQDGEGGLVVIDAETGAARAMGPPWSYARAAPVWASDGRSLRVLVDEARAPALLHFDLEGRAIEPRMPLSRIPDPAFWGIFDLDPTPDGGFIYLLERYEGDLYLLTAAP